MIPSTKRIWIPIFFINSGEFRPLAEPREVLLVSATRIVRVALNSSLDCLASQGLGLPHGVNVDPPQRRPRILSVYKPGHAGFKILLSLSSRLSILQSLSVFFVYFF
jgi:hypothetical protein